jgi:dolichol-phosphate mannosyltransferase
MDFSIPSFLTHPNGCATFEKSHSPLFCLPIPFNQISIVIPTYNEAGNLPALISALQALPLPGLSVLVVDDGSPDGTGEIADRLAAESGGCLAVLHRSGKLGLGTAYLEGFRRVMEAGAQAVGQMDADFSHPPEKLPELVEALENCDLALGSRYVPGGSVDCDWPVWRKGLSAFGNFYARTILSLPVRDVTGGFRLWRRSALESLPLERIRSNGYAFLIELTYLASRKGLQIREVPIYFADRGWGKSKMSTKIQREAAFQVWQMLWRYRDIQRTM